MAVEDLFQRAREAAERANYDYAVELFRTVLLKDPENVEARTGLRTCERRRLEMAGVVTRSMVNRIKGLLPLAKVIVPIGNPRKKLERYEDFLALNPNSVFALRGAGKAAAAADLKQAAIALLRDAVRTAPASKSSLRALTTVLRAAGEHKEALKYMNRLLQLTPQDRDLHKQFTDLSAVEHMAAHKIAETESLRDLVRDKDEAVATERDRRRSLTGDAKRAIGEVTEGLKDDPGNVNKIVRLAGLYEEQADYEKARQTLKDGLERLPENYEIRERIGSLQLRLMDKDLSRIEQELQEKPDQAELQQEQADLRDKRGKFALEHYRWRVEQHPTDRELRFQLGVLLFEEGDYDNAIAAFQQSARDAHLQADSASMLGQCFLHKKQYDLAVGQLEQAVAQHEQMDDKGKELQYNLALALELQDRKEEALKIYKKIYSVDIRFKDVAQKVESPSP